MPRIGAIARLRAALLAACMVGMGPADAAVLSPSAAATAQSHGTARVLVMLRHSPALAAEGVERRRQEIATQVDALLSRLPSRGFHLRRRFALVPAIAIDADLATLQQLRDDPRVIRIDLDLPGAGNAIAPDESSVLNDVSPLQGLGRDGSGMRVAVIDTGIDTHHLDLQPRLVDQQCFCSANGSGGCCPNGQASQGGTGSAEDDNGHGTNVAGIIVGQGNVAPRGAVPGAQLIVVKALDRNSRFCCSSDVVAAMDWVASHHPEVDAVNLSLGTDALFAGDCDNANASTQALAAALNALVANGAVVTVSTGNDQSSTMAEAPACVGNAASVAATWDFPGGARSFLGCTETSTAPRQPTCFSNRSATTDLYAAGAFVTSTGMGNGVSTYGGTSQAAPMVAACAIALKQAAPASTPMQRIDAMRLSSARVTDAASGRSYPFLDCMDALHLLARRSAGDFDGDGISDVFWRNRTTGADAIWRSADSATPMATTAVTTQQWQVVGIGDFDGDGRADLFWRNAATGANVVWRSGNAATRQAIASVADLHWRVAGIGDFDVDGQDDVLWRNAATGADAIWRSANAKLRLPMAAVTNLAWKISGVGDFDGDGRSDVFWRNAANGADVIWKSANAGSSQPATAVTNLDWQVTAVGDFDGDGHADLFWRNARTGGDVVWRSGAAATSMPVAAVTTTSWHVVAAGDYDGDGRDDLLWRDQATGSNAIWRSADASSRQAISPVGNPDWTIEP